MGSLLGILGMAEFEARRGLTLGRLASWSILATFPIVLLNLLTRPLQIAMPETLVGAFTYLLVSQIACPMVLLLLVTPLINSELEGKTWTYLCSRPLGRMTLVVGKLATAVTTAILVGFVGITGISMTMELREPFRFWFSQLAVMGMACVAYGCLFSVIGTWFQKRAMAIAMIYMLLVEGVVSLIPATLNQFTVTFRLRSLLYAWVGWAPQQGTAHLVDVTASGWHLIVVLAYVGITLGLSIARAQGGEYLMNNDQ